jgi:hypothetical protein
VELVGHFDPNNEYQPCLAVLEALRTEGVTIIDPGAMSGADDMKIEERLTDLMHLCGSAPRTTCVVLIANDKVFAPEVGNPKK